MTRLGETCFKRRFYLDTWPWGGRIWNIGILHHQVSLDFRKSWVDDMVFPSATKEDRKAVDDALKANAQGHVLTRSEAEGQ